MIFVIELLHDRQKIVVLRIRKLHIRESVEVVIIEGVMIILKARIGIVRMRDIWRDRKNIVFLKRNDFSVNFYQTASFGIAYNFPEIMRVKIDAVRIFI